MIVFAWAGLILVNLFGLPQIWKMWRTKNVGGQSLWGWIVLEGAMASLLIFNWSELTGQARLAYVIGNIYSLVVQTLAIYLIILYGGHGEKEE